MSQQVHRCPAGNHPVFLYADGTIVPHYHDDGRPCIANGRLFTEPPLMPDLADDIAADAWVKALNCLEDPAHVNGIEIVEIIAAAMRDYATLRLRDHTKAVGDFLSEMHATMVDPLADGTIPVKEVCELLLKRAREDREALAKLGRCEAALRPFADRSKHYRQKYGWHARPSDTAVVTLGECDAASAALGETEVPPDRPRILCTELDGQQEE